jgi:type I restriction enzyme S subunit
VISDLRPHAGYKDSGLPWLGQVPGHWDVRRIKTVLREVDRRSEAGREPLLSLRMQAGLVDHHASGGRPIPPSALVGYKRVLPGEIVMNRMRASAGLFAIATTDGLVSPDYAIFRAVDAVNMAYLVELFRTPAMKAIFRLESTGLGTGESGFLRLYSDQFGRLAIPMPPADEQAAIVRFLEWANGRLERAIRAKRKVIALLIEQRESMTQRAVTRGLDASAALRPTGTPWIAEVPSHWEVRPLKAVSAIQSGVTLGKDYGAQQTQPFPYLRVANVQAGFVELSEIKTIRVPVPEARRSTLEVGDVLMTEGGDPDKLGRGCVWSGQVSQCLHQNHVFAVRPDQQRLEPAFLSAFMGTSYARAYFQSTAKQTTNLASTNKTKIGRLQVPLPPVDEQRAILAQVAVQTQPVNVAIARLEAEIRLLREYRIRLVADVVTGKLDVREAATRLPNDGSADIDVEPTDEADDPELIDEEAAEA